jgi:nitrogen regulatory protein PII
MLRFRTAIERREPFLPQDPAMRLVVAVVKPAQLESTRQALAAVHVTRLTVCDTHGYGPDAPDQVRQEVMLEIAVNEDFVDRTVGTLAATLGAGGAAEPPRIFVLPIEDAVQIYRCVRGPEAV